MDEDLPIINESDFNAMFGGDDDLPEITESQFNALSLQAPSESGSSYGSLFTVPVAAAGRIADSALLGIPSKTVAGLDALTGEGLQALGLTPPKSFADSYSESIADWEGKSVNELGDGGALIADIGGGFVNPINKLGAVQKLNKLAGLKGIAGRTALTAGVSGTDALLDGENAGDAAITGAGVSAVLEGVVGPAGKLAGKVGKGMFNKGVGLTARDYAAAAKEMDLGKLGQGKERLLSALDEVKPRGLKAYLQSAGSTENYLTDLANAAEARGGQYGQKITSIIDEAERLAPGAQIDPDVALIAKGIDDLGSLDGSKIESNLLDRWDAFLSRYKNKGGSTLTNLQKEKVGMNRQLSDRPSEIESASLWRRGVRSALEKETDARAIAGGTNYKAGDLKEANLKYGALQSLKSSLEKDLPAAQSTDLGQTMRQGMWTTSGAGLQGAKNISEASKGGAIAATILSLANYLQPVGRVAGMGLEDAAKVVEKSLPGFRLGIAAALGEETETTPSDQTLSLEDETQASSQSYEPSTTDTQTQSELSREGPERDQVDELKRSPSSKSKPPSAATQDQFSGLLGLDDSTSSNPSIFSLKNASLFDVGGEMDAPQIEVRDMNPIVSQLEGGQKLDAYPPPAKGSGVTVATGIDLGQRSISELKNLGLPSTLIQKVSPYLGKKDNEATTFLKKNPLRLSKDEAETLDQAVGGSISNELSTKYTKATGQDLSAIPEEARTVLESVAYNFGPNLDEKLPSLWKHVVSSDWQGLHDFLINTKWKQPELTRRRQQEAALLTPLLNQVEA